MIVIEKYDGNKQYMFARGGIADRDAVLAWNDAALMYPHIVHTNEYGETLFYLYKLNDMRSLYDIPQGLTEAEAIQMIQDKMNEPPPEPEPSYMEFLEGMYLAVTGGSVDE